MKKLRVLPLLLCLALLLAGCGSLLESEYISVKPHTEQYAVEDDENALTAENYLSLKNAVLNFVENGVEKGVIRIYNYSGDVESDLAAATYEVAQKDPLGAYAVEYMTHDCAQIVSYYEAHVNITFRRTPEQIQAIQRAAGTVDLTELIKGAMEAYDDELTVRMSYYNNQDIQKLMRQYYDENPASVMEMPATAIYVYPDQPDDGYVRIIEMLMQYDQSAEKLAAKRDAVATSVRAASEYVRYRNTESGKVQLLYTYLLERFGYVGGTTTTPVYAFLCEGVADSEGCAKSMQIICDQIGLECHTVSGAKNGKPYYWNILLVDGVYCHADLLQSLFVLGDRLTLYNDSAMTAYEWDREQYPACP